MGHPESRNAAQSIMPSKGWKQLPNDPQALDLLSDRIDDIISSASNTLARRKAEHQGRDGTRSGRTIETTRVSSLNDHTLVMHQSQQIYKCTILLFSVRSS